MKDMILCNNMILTAIKDIYYVEKIMYTAERWIMMKHHFWSNKT